MWKTFALIALTAAAFVVPVQSARAGSEYDQDAYYYLQEGTNLAHNGYETYSDGTLYQAYIYGYYAEIYAQYAIDYNYKDYWADAMDYAVDAFYECYYAYEANPDEVEAYYAAVDFYYGYVYSYYAYENFWSSAF
jgi:hypothetical protein